MRRLKIFLHARCSKLLLKEGKIQKEGQLIVPLPEQRHFVVLGEADGEYVGLIDLDSNMFYYRRSAEWFNSVWDDTALLIAK